DELVTGALQVLAQTQRARHAAEELARLEVDALRRGCGLSTRVTLDARNVIARIALGVAADGIVVENAEYFRHGAAPFVGRCTESVRGTTPHPIDSLI